MQEIRTCGAEGREHNGQDKVEEINPKLFRKPQVMGKAREEGESTGEIGAHLLRAQVIQR